MDEIIPIFPLAHVLVPGMPLPLHIFEPRYRELLVDIRAASRTPSFGVVALVRGAEVGTNCVRDEPEFSQVGTVAEVLEVQPYEDGASDLFTVGSSRFRIRRVVHDRSYLRAEVDYLDERDGPLPSGLPDAVLRLHEEHSRQLWELTGREREPVPRVDANRLSYHLAAQLPLTPADRQALLEEPTTTSRLLLLAGLLRRELALLRATSTIAVSPGVLQLYVRPN